MERIRSLENVCKKLEVDILSDNKQWEVQKQAFI